LKPKMEWDWNAGSPSSSSRSIALIRWRFSCRCASLSSRFLVRNGNCDMAAVEMTSKKIVKGNLFTRLVYFLHVN